MKKSIREAFMENRKGQAEIFGLIVIVILLIFALIFFVQTRGEDSSTLNVRTSFRANNLLNSIMNVNLDDGKSLRVLMKDCVKTLNSLDFVDNNPVCGPPKSALEGILEYDQAKEEGNILLGSENYKFTGEKDNFIVIDLGDCTEGITANPSRLPGGYEFKLILC
jgi:hypothetical protein